MLLIPGASPGAPDASAAGADARAVVVPGQVVAGRRVPTKQEIATINASLAPVASSDAPVTTAGGDSKP
jgi:hypothetical protein